MTFSTNGLTANLSSGALTSAILAGQLTDETGTGAAVFSISPTLVTPALGTPTALVGTNITGTAAGLTVGTAVNVSGGGAVSAVSINTTSANSWSKTQRVTPATLNVSSNLVAVDFSLSNNFQLSLQATTGQTLSNPTNVNAGITGNITIMQNATPSTLSFGSDWVEATSGVAATVSTTPDSWNLLSYCVVGAKVYYVLNKAGIA